MSEATRAGWPILPTLADWQDTLTTVHMWSQIVGKVRLELSPWINHSWGSTLYVSTRGLTTSPISYQNRSFTIDFDFIGHALRITSSTGQTSSFALTPMTVADFYHATMAHLAELGIEVAMLARPVEVEVAIPFEEDTTHASYDGDAMHQFWRALEQASRVFTDFRSQYIGKVSPVHFFWGAFDLAVTRFSGRTAPKHPGGAPNCADWVMEEAYSHELSSAGFWPGTGLGEAAFYAYCYPTPAAFKEQPVGPAESYYHDQLGEFVLPYDAVQRSNKPDQVLLSFLQSTYEAAANTAKWDRAALEASGVYPPTR